MLIYLHMVMGLDLQQWLFVLILSTSILLFITEWVSIDVTSLLIIVSLIICNILDAKSALSGFSSEPAIIVMAVFVLSAGLSATGVTDRIGDVVGKMAGSREWQAILVFMLVVALLSAFTHHLMITAMMLPVVMRYCREKNIYSSRILIPMATAASLGTTMTIISAPAFLLANNILFRAGETKLQMFDVFPIGISLTLLSIVFVILTRWVLPKRSGEEKFENRFQIEQFYTEIEIPKDSKWIQTEFKDFRNATEKRFIITDWVRRGRARHAYEEDALIEQNDIFLINASPDEIMSIDDDMGIELKPVKEYKDTIDLDEGDHSPPMLLQAVLAPSSKWVGRNLRATNFLHQLHLIVVGVWRKNGWLHGKLSSIEFRANDLLVFWGKSDSFEALLHSKDFVFLTPLKTNKKNRSKALLAILIMVGSILTASFEILDTHIAFLTGAIAMCITKCISLERAYKSIEVKIFVLIAGVIPLGIAMEKTGLAKILANNISSLMYGWDPFTVLLVLFSVAAILTQVLSDAATTVLLAPIAILIAVSLKISPTAAVVCTTVGAVASFLTPIGHHGNLLILSPGNYRFADFLKIGLPLTIFIAITTTYLCLRIWH